MTWFEIREELSEKGKLFYLGESANNEACGMVFDVSAFCTNDYRKLVRSVLPRKILSEGFGSGAIDIKCTNGNCIWGVHFPLDFRFKGSNNLGAKTMKNLCTLMKSIGKSCVFGHFNTIPGCIIDSIKNAIDDEFSFIIDDGKPTFFGSYCDEVHISSDEEDNWTQLI